MVLRAGLEQLAGQGTSDLVLCDLRVHTVMKSMLLMTLS